MRARDFVLPTTPLLACAVAALGLTAFAPRHPSRHPGNHPGHTVTVTASDFSFDAPAKIPAGLTTIRLVNHGHELHHVTLVRMPAGKTMADVVAEVREGAPMPVWMDFAGGAVGTMPGGMMESTVMLDPGTYLLVCFIRGTDLIPHLRKGMMRPITVTGATSGGMTVTEPASDVAMVLTDYGFAISPTLTAGAHTIRVDNRATQPHEAVLMWVPPGKRPADMVAWAMKPVGPRPMFAVAGIQLIRPGAHGYFTVTLEPGTYALFCFFPDSRDGKPHIAHGMVRELKVS